MPVYHFRCALLDSSCTVVLISEGVICRTVIVHADLDVAVGLSKCRIDRLLDVFRDVVRRMYIDKDTGSDGQGSNDDSSIAEELHD